ncbi:unnamed protein product [Hymenolepis diminuta]|uniref:Mos1 transposase HTH domain-containing protein n=1 Tax=Hymenolepis diminuta TaxID=6216 RepID=A0A564YHV2_HYMDI|nr:unnamed protein product [Hymenolepis diminuta]
MGISGTFYCFNFIKEIRRASSAANTLKDTYGNDVVNEKTCRRWFSADGFKKDDPSLKDESRAGCSKNSILSSCKLPLMKIQPALLENWAKSLT